MSKGKAKRKPDAFKRTHVHYSKQPEMIRVVEHESRPHFLIQILGPRWSVGDRARNVGGCSGHGAEVVVEEIYGPYTHHTSDRQDAYIYRVYEAARDVRYSVKGKNIERIARV